MVSKKRSREKGLQTEDRVLRSKPDKPSRRVLPPQGSVMTGGKMGDWGETQKGGENFEVVRLTISSKTESR